MGEPEQQRKNVGQALTRPIAHELVERRFAVTAIEQAAARPHRPTHRCFAKDDIENPLPIDADSRIPLENGRDRSRALEPHVEPIVIECQDERVCRALRNSHRKGPGELAPDPVVDARIQQRVGQLADAFLRDLAQREEGVIRQRPGQERDDMRDESGAEPSSLESTAIERSRFPSRKARASSASSAGTVDGSGLAFRTFRSIRRVSCPSVTARPRLGACSTRLVPRVRTYQ